MTVNPDFYDAKWVIRCGFMWFNFMSKEDAIRFVGTGIPSLCVPAILDDEVDVTRN